MDDRTEISLAEAPERILLVFALELEAQFHFSGFKVLFTGVGKINAASALTRELALWEYTKGAVPDLVLNLGSAGSRRFPPGTVVNCTRFVQHDMDVTALGCEPYATPFEDIPPILQYGERYPDYPEAVCGTGDRFETIGRESVWDVVDMEAYALAKICARGGIRFGCLKYITDGADDNAAEAWTTVVRKTAEGLLASAEKIHADWAERTKEPRR